MSDEASAGATQNGGQTSAPSGEAPPSTPSSTPSATPDSGVAPSNTSPTQETPRSAGDESVFEGLGRDFDDFSFEIDPNSLSEEGQQSAQSGASSAQPAEEKGEGAQQGLQQPPSTTTAAEPAQTEQQGSASTAVTPKSLVEQFAERRQDIIAALAQERFALSKEEEEEFELNPVAAVPKLASRIYYEAVTATLNHINNLVPHMIGQFLQAQKASDAAEAAFYKRFGALSREKHHSDVIQYARAFRAANPNITQDDLFAMVGAAVMAKYGLTSPGAQNGAAQVVKPTPFVPAPSGASVKTAPEPANPWEGLGGEYDD